jgi:hypothetical protein
MGARLHNFLLLTLARQRLADAARGEPEVSCGWLDQEELAHDPTMSGARLYLACHRIRNQFATLNIVDPSNVIERRMQKIRIGTGDIEISSV